MFVANEVRNSDGGIKNWLVCRNVIVFVLEISHKSAVYDDLWYYLFFESGLKKL